MQGCKSLSSKCCSLVGELLNTFPRTNFVRNTVLAILYTIVIIVCYFVSWQLRFDFNVPASYSWIRDWGWFFVVSSYLISLMVFKQFGSLLGYFSLPDLGRVILATTVANVPLFLLWVQFGSLFGPPRGVLLINFVLTTTGIAAIRVFMRKVHEYCRSARNGSPPAEKRVAILGAGDVGASLVRELNVKKGMALKPVMFLDDDPGKWGCHIHGVPVLGKPEDLNRLAPEYKLDGAIIAMPSAPAKRIGELVKLLQKLHLEYRTVPSMEQLATGNVKVTQLRPVDIEDLLGREVVKLDMDNIRSILQNEIVMVTGAGGSIGSELCRQMLKHPVSKLLMVERSEGQLFEIEQELKNAGHENRIIPIVADILDAERMEWIFNKYKPTIIFHAAAHKHVPMMEIHPAEAIKNNSMGTAFLADLSIKHSIKRFVLISTDKAINPTSVMGASKRLAELYIQALYKKNGSNTRFISVRFGNVLGSSGSVVTIFRRQIAEGGPVKVTHPDMRRYFMTIPEAVSLVLQSAALGEGGEIFVLDMGQPVKIVDLARQMIELSGLRPGVDIDIVFTGPRPGEKLFEELFYDKEKHIPTKHPKIMKFIGTPPSYEQVSNFLKEIQPYLHNGDPSYLKNRLRQIIPEYTPQN